ncbi:MAG: hypothetical protein LDL51_06920, partial [Chloroflexi bacterium]|nr:hypothetical protein [Chloroflexota bacterium]
MSGRFYGFLASRMAFFYVRKAAQCRDKAARFGMLLVSLLSLGACQPSLWGAPPPPPTMPSNVSASFTAT